MASAINITASCYNHPVCSHTCSMIRPGSNLFYSTPAADIALAIVIPPHRNNSAVRF